MAEGLEPPPLARDDETLASIRAWWSPAADKCDEESDALSNAGWLLRRVDALAAQVEKLQRERDDWKHNAESQFAAIAEQVRMRDEALAELARLRPVVEAAQRLSVAVPDGPGGYSPWECVWCEGDIHPDRDRMHEPDCEWLALTDALEAPHD